MTHEERIEKITSNLDPQAFPSIVPADTVALLPGISKREYFALHLWKPLGYPDVSAADAVHQADALLAELERTRHYPMKNPKKARGGDFTASEPALKATCGVCKEDYFIQDALLHNHPRGETP